MSLSSRVMRVTCLLSMALVAQGCIQSTQPLPSGDLMFKVISTVSLALIIGLIIRTRSSDSTSDVSLIADHCRSVMEST